LDAADFFSNRFISFFTFQTTVPQLLFSGFFVSIAGIPFWLQWLQWVMPLTYSFRLVAAEEFSFCDPVSDPNMLNILCQTYLEKQQATDEFRLQYWATLIGIVVLFRILAVFFLRRKIQ